MGVAAADQPGVGPRKPLDRDGRIEILVEAVRLRAGRGVGDEEHRVIDPQAPFGGQATQPRETLIPDRLVGPLRCGAEGIWNALGQPRERGRIVEIGHRNVGIALDDERAVGLQLADRVDGCRRLGAIEDEVAGHGDGIGLDLLDVGPNCGQRGGVAVDVGQHRDPGHDGTPAARLIGAPKRRG